MAANPPPNPIPYPPKTAAFINSQNRAGYMHSIYRATGDSNVNWAQPNHVAGLANWTQPGAGLGAYAQGPAPNSAAARALRNASIVNRGTVAQRGGDFIVGQQPAPRPGFNDRGLAQGMLNRNIIRTRMARNNISYVRQLGWGQDGTSTLWHFANPDPAGLTGNVVCKVAFPNSTTALTNDLVKLSLLARSPHIVHRAELFLDLWPFPDLQTARDALNLDWSAEHSWTEHARHGDLAQWIARVTEDAESFPRSVLWRIFECLTEACVAMAYPPREQSLPQALIYGAELPEIIPGVPLPNGFANVVHLCLDPSNVFVEDFDNTHHVDVPRIQVGDFGRSVTPNQLGLPNFMPLNNFVGLTRLWWNRRQSKDGWFLPEQFTEEWDRVDYEPFSENITDMATGVGAAGSFTPKSNIFHVGLVIWCCITLQVPERPPRLTPVPKSGANMGNQGWTYVGEMRMREFHGRFGRNLCELVGDCCKHMPADRPDLTQLRARVAAGVAANPVTNDDIRFIQRTLQNPAPPIIEPPTLVPGAIVLLPF